MPRPRTRLTTFGLRSMRRGERDRSRSSASLRERPETHELALDVRVRSAQAEGSCRSSAAGMPSGVRLPCPLLIALASWTWRVRSCATRGMAGCAGRGNVRGRGCRRLRRPACVGAGVTLQENKARGRGLVGLKGYVTNISADLMPGWRGDRQLSRPAEHHRVEQEDHHHLAADPADHCPHRGPRTPRRRPDHPGSLSAPRRATGQSYTPRWHESGQSLRRFSTSRISARLIPYPAILRMARTWAACVMGRWVCLAARPSAS